MNNQGKLSGKIALITGANSGIGKACVKKFLDDGAKVLASDITQIDLAEYDTDQVTAFKCDVTNSSEVESMITFALSTFGGINILVNSAGVSSRNALADDSNPEEIWDRVIDINLTGTYLASWYAVPEIERSGGGSIINLASIMGHVGYPSGLNEVRPKLGFDAYPPSKGGVVQFTKSLAIELATRGIRVNCVCPGYIETNLTKNLRDNPETYNKLINLHPMKRLGKASEIADAALFLASDDASFITGSSLLVDGGYTAQ